MTKNLTSLTALLGQAQHRALVISAYVKARTLDALLEVSASVPERAVFARWGVDDIASGASDWHVWDVAAAHDVPLFACPDLHAKVYVADDRAVVGSANATPSGLGHGQRSNLEILLEVDAGRKEVVDVIDQVREASFPAPPFGPDVVSGGDPIQSNTEPQRPSIWIPRSDPETFLDAIVGKGSHNAETNNDREALGLHREPHKRSDIVTATSKMTVFRLVRREFQTRMIGMRQADLASLLSERLDPSCADVPLERLSLLAQWLGWFGENTHLAPTKPDESPVLEPGGLLSSERH